MEVQVGNIGVWLDKGGLTFEKEKQRVVHVEKYHTDWGGGGEKGKKMGKGVMTGAKLTFPI